jgi:hypothetical protein
MKQGGAKMKHNLLIVLTAVTAMVTISLLGAASAQPFRMTAHSSAHEVCAEESDSIGHEFDLDACQRDCRFRFGYSLYGEVYYPMWGGSRNDASNIAYSNCILECNREHWKRFDKEMEDLEKQAD